MPGSVKAIIYDNGYALGTKSRAGDIEIQVRLCCPDEERHSLVLRFCSNLVQRFSRFLCSETFHCALPWMMLWWPLCTDLWYEIWPVARWQKNMVSNYVREAQVLSWGRDFLQQHKSVSMWFSGSEQTNWYFEARCSFDRYMVNCLACFTMHMMMSVPLQHAKNGNFVFCIFFAKTCSWYGGQVLSSSHCPLFFPFSVYQNSLANPAFFLPLSWAGGKKTHLLCRVLTSVYIYALLFPVCQDLLGPGQANLLSAKLSLLHTKPIFSFDLCLYKELGKV